MENDYLDMGNRALYQTLAAAVSEAITESLENNLEFIRDLTDVNSYHPRLNLERLITTPTKGVRLEDQVHNLPDSEYKNQIMDILGIEPDVIEPKGGRRRRRTRSKLRKLKSRNSKRRRYRK
jgi:hypothetical protein